MNTQNPTRSAKNTVIIVDTREQLPLEFSQPSVRGTLTSGDYSLVGAENLFAIERKSITDLTNCCCGENRQRFERELMRLRGYRFSRLLVIGEPQDIAEHRYVSRIHPNAVLASLAVWEIRFLPISWAATPASAARQIESWAGWFAREVMKEAAALQAAETSVLKKGTL